MTDIPRQELEELVSKYTLHPSIFDMFVEGDFDRDFLNQYIECRSASSNVSVFSINTIDIPDRKLTELKLGLGSNKNRVVALATLIEERLNNMPSNVFCIVDADFDRILNKTMNKKHLMYTDFTCMEMYFCNSPTLKKFLTFTCKLKESLYDEFIKIASIILPIQFATRIANENLKVNTPIPGYSRGLKIKGNFNSFDRTKYLDAFISDGNLKPKKAAIFIEQETVSNLLPKDLRHKANGHDFVELLFDYIWKNGGVKLHNKDEEVLKFGGRLLATAQSINNLSPESLFLRIDKSLLSTNVPSV